MKLTLLRVGPTKQATFGVLRDENLIPFAVTLENPWLDNQRNVSCIPEGRYECKRVQSPRFGNTFEVTNVPNRSHILFHKGNKEDDTQGCILVGETFVWFDGVPAIGMSKQGYGEFMSRLDGLDEFTLDILTVEA